MRSIADDLFTRMTTGRESFWHIVYPLFMSRDLTREELRTILRRGLERTGGNYKSLVELSISSRDYKRFLNFLRKHQVGPFQRFRSARPAPPRRSPANAGGTRQARKARGTVRRALPYSRTYI
jgi:hypothetical protein